MFDRLFDLPLAIVGPGIIVLLLLAVFIGLIIFIIFALDHPFRGDLALRSDPINSFLITW